MNTSEQSSIVIVEDNAMMRKLLRYTLSPEHTLRFAVTRAEAEQTLRHVAMGKIVCRAIVLDGNLTGAAMSGADGRELLALIDELGIEAPVLGFSSDPMDGAGFSGTFLDVGKSRVTQLPGILAEL